MNSAGSVHLRALFTASFLLKLLQAKQHFGVRWLTSYAIFVHGRWVTYTVKRRSPPLGNVWNCKRSSNPQTVHVNNAIHEDRGTKKKNFFSLSNVLFAVCFVFHICFNMFELANSSRCETAYRHWRLFAEPLRELQQSTRLLLHRAYLSNCNYWLDFF